MHCIAPHVCHTSEPVRAEPAPREHDVSPAATSANATSETANTPVLDRGARCIAQHPRSACGPTNAGPERRSAADAEPSASGHTLLSVFRLSSRADPAFLAEMLYEAVNWRDDGAEERPPLEELLAQPEMRRYVESWGRKGDTAIVALDRLDEPVGAAWYRLFEAAEPGYGFVAPDVPELSIAVYPECRGQHVGGLLLGSIVNRARAVVYRAISLSVAEENPARRLYARQGFEVAVPAGVNHGGTSLTMVLELS